MAIRCPEPPPEAPFAHRPQGTVAGVLGWVKGGVAAARPGAGTLDPPEHSGSLARGMGRPSRPRAGPLTPAMASNQPARSSSNHRERQHRRSRGLSARRDRRLGQGPKARATSRGRRGAARTTCARFGARWGDVSVLCTRAKSAREGSWLRDRPSLAYPLPLARLSG